LFRLLADGWRHRDLADPLANLLGIPASALTPGRLTYQLRRLRLHGLIARCRERIATGSPSTGLRFALFCTRATARSFRRAWRWSCPSGS